MKRRNNKILSVMLLFTAFAYGAGNEPSLYKISISLPQRSFKLGEPIVAHVSLKNISNEKIIVGRANGPQQAQFSYRVTVTDESKRPVLLRSSIRQPGEIHKPSAFGRVSEDLQPNETLDEDCVITELFILDKSGKYVLEFARWIPGSKNTFLHSNTVTFSIIR
jgi:hypothetical protein